MEPIVEEQYRPDRTILKLTFVEKEVLPDFLPENKKDGRIKGDRLIADEIKKRKEIILQLITVNCFVTINDMVEKLEVSRGMVESA